MKRQLLLGWLGCGEVYCGHGARPGATSGPSSPEHSLELGGTGWERAGASGDSRMGVGSAANSWGTCSLPVCRGSQSGRLQVGPLHHTHSVHPVR